MCAAERQHDAEIIKQIMKIIPLVNRGRVRVRREELEQ